MRNRDGVEERKRRDNEIARRRLWSPLFVGELARELKVDMRREEKEGTQKNI